MSEVAEPTLEIQSRAETSERQQDIPTTMFTNKPSNLSEAPSFDPPHEESTATAVDSATASVWLNNKKITTMWCTDQAENAFAAIEGEGWRKIDNSSPSAFTNLTMLLSAAAQTGANCRIYLTDNVISRVYVF